MGCTRRALVSVKALRTGSGKAAHKLLNTLADLFHDVRMLGGNIVALVGVIDQVV